MNGKALSLYRDSEGEEFENDDDFVNESEEEDEGESSKSSEDDNDDDEGGFRIPLKELIKRIIPQPN